MATALVVTVKGQQVDDLPGMSDGVLRLPAPVVPLAIGNIGPGRVAGRGEGSGCFGYLETG